jgi:hypothetical protein
VVAFAATCRMTHPIRVKVRKRVRKDIGFVVVESIVADRRGGQRPSV